MSRELQDEGKYIYDHPMPTVIVEIIPFSIFDGKLKVFLMEDESNKYSFCGTTVRNDECLEEAASRSIKEKIGTINLRLEQLYTYDNDSNDHRDKVVTVVYYAIVMNGILETFASKGKWLDTKNGPDLPPEHRKILEYTIQRLTWKAEYSTIVFSLIPPEFTLTELRKAYEILLDRKLDHRNFVKKIKSLDIIDFTGNMQEKTSHRPAKLYKLKEGMGKVINVM
jgi:8-oxo-dGTP diphosphatase